MRIACPHCGKRLKVPDERAGGVGKCPQCSQRFRVPEPDPVPAPPGLEGIDWPDLNAGPPLSAAGARPSAPRDQDIAKIVRLPATFLLIGGIIGITGALLGVASGVIQIVANPDDNFLGRVGAASGFLLTLAASIYVVMGANSMLQLKNHSIAKVGAILALIPCIGPCCAIPTLPFGIWALVVLMRPEVKAAFRS
jgi:predicted Zn finger-like uncharacterized protein